MISETKRITGIDSSSLFAAYSFVFIVIQQQSPWEKCVSIHLYHILYRSMVLPREVPVLVDPLDTGWVTLNGGVHTYEVW